MPVLGALQRLQTICSNYTRIAAPLDRKPQKDQQKKFELWNDKEWQGITKLHEKFRSPPILALPYAEEHYTLPTKICDLQFGCILLQKQSKNAKKAIGYRYRSHTKAEKTYDATERECLESVSSMLWVRPKLKKGIMIIPTDHSSHLWILILTDT